MGFYKKKPVVIQAAQFQGFGIDGQVVFDDKPQWLVDQFGGDILFFNKVDTLTIKTLEGEHIASIGDYIIRGVEGELYPCKPEIFKKTYEHV